jgi:dolichol-phosphate mannosyltransferase
MHSVIVPVYNEEETIELFYDRITPVLRSISDQYEIIFVNDGSTDDSLSLLRGIVAKDPKVVAVSFSRNFGHQIAVSAGIDHARGHAVIVIDGDLQDPPELIPEMLAKWKEGYQVVYAQRKRRKGESLFKKITAFAFYRTLRAMTSTDIPLDTGDFRLMDRSVVEVLKNMRERSRFIRGMVAWVGFRQIGVEFERDERFSGKTKYHLSKMIRFALNGIFSFSDKPLKIASYIGLFTSFIGMLMIIWGLYSKIFRPETTIAGWASVFVAVLFFGGIQLFTIGIIGEYISRIYDESKARPLYVVGEYIRNEHSGPCA